MDRRGLLKSFGMIAVASLWSGAASCKNIYAEIVQYVGVGIQAATSVVNLLAGAGVVSLPTGTAISAVLTEIKTLWGDVSAAVSDYQGTPTTTAAQKVTVALQVVAEYIQKFWTDLSIPDPKLANTVAGLLGLVLSTIQGFLPSLPPVPVTQVKTLAASNAKALQVIAKKRDIKTFRKEFNAILTQGGYQQHAI